VAPTAAPRRGLSLHAIAVRPTALAVYEVDGHDKVVLLEELPQPDPGAPMPALVAAEHRLELGYIARPPEPFGEERIAVATFVRPYAHMFGPPNDEAFEGHPLAARGLEPYGCYRIESSSWIRRLERMNAVHPYHRAEEFARRTHYVFAFHDTTFECVADDVQVTLHPADRRLPLSIEVTP
jgi:hypothetical protein